MSDAVHDDRPWMRLNERLQPDREAFTGAERDAAPETAAGLLPGGSRRGFLKALGLSAASLAACKRLPVRRALPYLVAPEEITPGVPTFYASTCLACPANCGTLAKVLDGRPVKLEGNPEHPISRGGLCAIGQADLRSLYDPERFHAPLLNGSPTDWPTLDGALRARLDEVASSQGAVYVVSSTITSPTARRAVNAFLEPYGGTLVEHDLDPQVPSAALDAYGLLTGQPLLPALDLEPVDLLVCLGADLFGTGPDPVGHTASWSSRRRAGEHYGPPRHLQIEGSLSLTGANADERWTATAAEREHIALWILREVAARFLVTGAPEIRAALAALTGSPPRQAQMRSLVDELVAAPGRSLLVSDSERVAEQLAVALTNRLLGNEGRTLDLERPAQIRRGRDHDLSAFRADLASGAVGAVVVVDLDLVGRLPDGAAIGAQLGAVPLSVGIFQRPSATAAACQVVAAAHHGLECWADAEPRAGLVTLAQPTIRPLFDTRHPWENFLIWSQQPVTDWRRELQRAWGQGGADATAGAAVSTPEWNELVRTAGLGAASSGGATSAGDATNAAAASAAAAAGARARVPAAAPREPTAPPTPVLETLSSAAARPLPAISELQLEVVTEVACRSGKHAANPWLRELPDPLTRVSWAPCARVAPRRAREAGITDGDLLEIHVGDARVTLPAVVLPGQHPDVVAVPAGYAAWDESNAQTTSSGAPEATAGLLSYTDGSGSAAAASLQWRGQPARLAATGGVGLLPRIQVHASTEGRPIIHQVGAHDEIVHEPHYPDADLWPSREASSPHWGMVIDLDACVGCGGCVIACQAENNIATVGADQMDRHRDMYWLRIDRYFVGDADDPEVLFEPMLCAQCDKAPCETVCPVAATVQSEGGLNQQVYNRCVGTRYCANNCPYKVRRFNWYDLQPTDPVERLVLNPDVVVRSRGVMEKCTFCVQRIQTERIGARRNGRPAYEVQTACQQSCPAQAIRFGDAADPDSVVADARAKPRSFRVLAELGIEPSITYMARIRNRGASDGDDDGATEAPEHGDNP